MNFEQPFPNPETETSPGAWLARSRDELMQNVTQNLSWEDFENWLDTQDVRARRELINTMKEMADEADEYIAIIASDDTSEEGGSALQQEALLPELRAFRQSLGQHIQLVEGSMGPRSME